MLAKIILNGVKILDAVREGNVVYDSWWEQWGNISPVPKKAEILRIEAVNTRPFDKTNLVYTLKKAKANLQEDSSSLGFGSIKISSGDSKKISNARAVISTCIYEADKLNNLLEVDGESHSFNSIDEFVREIIEPLRASDSCRICLKITKNIVCQIQEIPLAPPKPEFTVEEIEEILKILLQVDKIIEKI